MKKRLGVETCRPATWSTKYLHVEGKSGVQLTASHAAIATAERATQRDRRPERSGSGRKKKLYFEAEVPAAASGPGPSRRRATHQRSSSTKRPKSVSSLATRW